MVTGTIGTEFEADTGAELLPDPFSLASLTVTGDEFLLPAEAVKEAKENIARKKLLMKIKRVIKKVL